MASNIESTGPSNAPPFDVQKYNKIKEMIEHMLQNTFREQRCLVIRY
jgi:hypothetical protein